MSPLGFDQTFRVVNLNDTVDLYLTLHDENGDPISSEDVSSISYVVQKPDGTKTTQAGTIESDGRGFLRYSTTAQVGSYNAVGQFTLSNGAKQSVRQDFTVIDPLDPPEATNKELVASAVWDRLEDCFDSEYGGPWLRDMTMDHFDPSKIPQFIEDAIFEINNINPPTDSVLGEFTATPDNGETRPLMPLIVQGTLLVVIRHLMRSYTEQPQPMGAQVVYEDRRDYLQRWQTIYQAEAELWLRWVKLWKRRALHLGEGKLLVSSKAGRLLPAPLRTRNIGRGYYVQYLPLLLIIEQLLSK